LLLVSFIVFIVVVLSASEYKPWDIKRADLYSFVADLHGSQVHPAGQFYIIEFSVPRLPPLCRRPDRHTCRGNVVEELNALLVRILDGIST
jgi:hypothetical protein